MSLTDLEIAEHLRACPPGCLCTTCPVCQLKRPIDNERALLDDCTGRKGCQAELHLVGCPSYRKPPPPPAPVQLRPYSPLPDPTNLEYRGGRLGRVLGQSVLFWLGLLVGGLTPGAPYPIALAGLGFALLFAGVYYAVRQ